MLGSGRSASFDEAGDQLYIQRNAKPRKLDGTSDAIFFHALPYFSQSEQESKCSSQSFLAWSEYPLRTNQRR